MHHFSLADDSFPHTAHREYFLEENSSIAIGEPPQRIHILTGIAGATFAECYKNHLTFNSEGVKVPFIGLDALIKTKEAINRDQDELDLKRLRALRELQKKKRRAR